MPAHPTRKFYDVKERKSITTNKYDIVEQVINGKNGRRLITRGVGERRNKDGSGYHGISVIISNQATNRRPHGPRLISKYSSSSSRSRRRSPSRSRSRSRSRSSRSKRRNSPSRSRSRSRSSRSSRASKARKMTVETLRKKCVREGVPRTSTKTRAQLLKDCGPSATRRMTPSRSRRSRRKSPSRSRSKSRRRR